MCKRRCVALTARSPGNICTRNQWANWNRSASLHNVGSPVSSKVLIWPIWKWPRSTFYALLSNSVSYPMFQACITWPERAIYLRLCANIAACSSSFSHPPSHLLHLLLLSPPKVEQFRSELFPSPVTPSSPFSKGPRAPDSRFRVSPNYKGYRLGSLLCHPRKIGHLMSFLQNQDARWVVITT